ncbi:hypothetical protein SAMN04490179_3079 [Pseudomonas antarctica]|uniref:Uncharacterized protein n=1 Tax=Pseudomonas antarctica TaxID=219572 RepID=A0A1G9ZFZ1_9PSED|nr:hypothetical protein PSAN_36460 [Pseudomonas antarctica]SDN20238.1 hypothetical protein SAMN04490179_3079 [Pseudomonas antarctica]
MLELEDSLTHLTLAKALDRITRDASGRNGGVAWPGVASLFAAQTGHTKANQPNSTSP